MPQASRSTPTNFRACSPSPSIKQARTRPTVPVGTCRHTYVLHGHVHPQPPCCSLGSCAPQAAPRLMGACTTNEQGWCGMDLAEEAAYGQHVGVVVGPRGDLLYMSSIAWMGSKVRCALAGGAVAACIPQASAEFRLLRPLPQHTSPPTNVSCWGAASRAWHVPASVPVSVPVSVARACVCVCGRGTYLCLGWV